MDLYSCSKRQQIKMPDFDIVDTDLGRIRGIKNVSALQAPYSAFLGVPYAKAPLGELRFKVSDRSIM